jgi:hypothetical protein
VLLRLSQGSIMALDAPAMFQNDRNGGRKRTGGSQLGEMFEISLFGRWLQADASLSVAQQFDDGLERR